MNPVAKDFQNREWLNLLPTVGCSTQINSYIEDKTLATPEWLQENKEAIEKNLEQRKNRQYFVNNSVNLLVGRIIERLRYAPSFNPEKYPSIDSESGEIILVGERRRDYRKEREYNKEILDYLLNCIQNPQRINNFAINQPYENEIWGTQFYKNICVIAIQCIKIFALSYKIFFEEGLLRKSICLFNFIICHYLSFNTSRFNRDWLPPLCPVRSVPHLNNNKPRHFFLAKAIDSSIKYRPNKNFIESKQPF